MPRRLGSDTSAQEVTVASAATVNLGNVRTRQVAISGTTTITSFGLPPNGEWVVRFTGAMTLTHNATSLILPGNANIVTAAGDTCIVDTDASGNARVLAYQRQSRSPDAAANLAATAVQPPGEWTSYTPAISATSGTITTLGTVTGKYVKIGRMVTATIDISITNIGNAGGALVATLPFSANVLGTGSGREFNTSGAQLQCFAGNNSPNLFIYNYGNGFPAASNSRCIVTITFESTT